GQADRDAEDGGPGPEDERVPEGLEVEAASQRAAEVLEREPAVGRDAAPSQRDQREHDQDEQRQRGGAERDVLGGQPPSRAEARSRRGERRRPWAAPAILPATAP